MSTPQVSVRTGDDDNGVPTGIKSFGLQPDDMVIALRESQNLGFNGGTISGPFDSFANVYTEVEVVSNDLMRLRSGYCLPTNDLLILGDNLN